MKVLLVDLKLILSLTFISLFLILFDALGYLKFPKSLVQYATVPVQYGFYKSGKNITAQFQFIILTRRASLENIALKKQMGELLTENSNLRQKISENETLIDSYGKLSPKTYDLLPARIIGASRYLTIDKGGDDGVAQGQVVVFKDNYVGQIKDVSPKSSQVLLVFDPDSKIAVFSQNNAGRSKGILQGQFGSELLMDKILHQELLDAGDLVYSEGAEGRLPKGLIMGKISEVLERQNEVFKQAKVETVFNLTDLDMVFVIKGS